MNKILHLTIMILLGFSCSNINSSKEHKKDESNNKQSLTGVYSYSDSSIESIITVVGNTWSGKLIIKSGFGASYDHSNASYSNGIIKDRFLFDDSGYIELGSVDGTRLSIPIGNNIITHYK